MDNDIKFMNHALTLGKKAFELGEVPVGAVVVKDGKIISEGYNMREIGKNALLHAEMIAINNACTALGGWRLHQCDLYVTLEPCPMCTGAIINSRIKRVVYGASDFKAGCLGSVCNLNDLPFNHKPEVVKGILKEDCSSLLKEFFKNLRNR